MNYILMFAIVMGVSLQDILKKKLSLSHEPAWAMDGYRFFMAAAAFITHLFLTGRTLSWHLPSFGYGALFAIGFTAAIYGSIAAASCGPVSLTALFSSFGLAIPTLYGVIFLKESLAPTGIIGLIALGASLVLVNWNRGNQEKLSSKWLILALIGFAGNGCCSLMQKLHQTAYPGLYAGDLLISGMLLVTLFSLLIFLKAAKKDPGARKPFPFSPLSLRLGGSSGVFNALVNFGMVYLSARMPAAILYPTVSAGSIALSFCVMRFIYREKLSLIKQIGFFLGFAAVLLMNL